MVNLTESERMEHQASLFYDLCLPALVDHVFGPRIFLGSGDADVRALADPLQRALPNLREQFDALLRQLARIQGFADEPEHKDRAGKWIRIVNDFGATDNPVVRWNQLIEWAETDANAHAAQVYALYAALVYIRDSRGPWGIAHGLPPSLRLTRFGDYWEYNKTASPLAANSTASLLYEWGLSIVRHEGDAFWTRLDRYIEFLEDGWLARIVRESPMVRAALARRLREVPPDAWDTVAYQGVRRLLLLEPPRQY
jgi:hypothetical protein